MTFIPLSLWDLVLAGLLLVINAGLSLAFELGLARTLLIAALRMVVQLALLGLVLRFLFTEVSPWLTGLAALTMILFAGYEIFARQERRFSGWWSYGLGTGCMLFAATTVTLFALSTQIEPEPWYHPQFAIPLLGMILGNTMTGISLGLNTMLVRAGREQAAIEAMLCLGYPRRTAFQPLIREALRSGLIPIINAMAAAGLVSLPGMMTGQILAGIEPMEAIKYQILIMFLIAGGTGIGVMTAIFGGARRLSDSRHRLRLDHLTESA